MACEPISLASSSLWVTSAMRPRCSSSSRSDMGRERYPAGARASRGRSARRMELPRFVDGRRASWRCVVVLPGGIANILHRDTIALIVGTKVFERGEACFASGRVTRVEAGRGELRGTVRPQEAGRAAYAVRIWVRED